MLNLRIRLALIRCGDFSDFAIYIASMAVVAVVLVGLGHGWW